MSEDKRPNRLINETSPYLLQHAYNPVDWYPWSQEAIEKARMKDMPILLSIGYSSCHWCHVMERESFENEAIARLMNKNFICIKVDREERPDLDEIYMSAVQAMTGLGGWPMTVFLTPDLKPFYVGTYFPPDDIPGRPGFVTVLRSISRFYREQRDQVESHSDQVADVLQQLSELSMSHNEISPVILDKSYRQLRLSYDPKNSGFGGAPKFPQPMTLSFLLRYWKRTDNADALEMVEHTLRKMAEGGVYDHLGGGFHRYSVDEAWLIPHFEKMLYDNALLSGVYLEAYRITNNRLYLDIASETLDYALREMYHSQGGFYSAQDADTEGEEGKYYLWSFEEIKRILGDDADTFARYFGISKRGNFERGRNILHVSSHLADTNDSLKSIIKNCKAKLLREREKRVHPGLDDKILTSWTALMISSMAIGYQVLRNKSYLESACKSADFILEELARDGMLLRTYRNNTSKLNAYSEDYAFFINSLIDLYETTFDIKWLKEAIRLNSVFVEEFWDAGNSGFFYTGESHEELIVRSKSASDGAMPSANSMSAMNLLKLAKITGHERLRDMAEMVFRLFIDQIEYSPNGFAQMLCALDFYMGGVKEIAVVGRKRDTEGMIDAIHSFYIPNKVLVYFDPDTDSNGSEIDIPLLNGRTENKDDAVVYVCEDYVCKTPINDAGILKKYLSENP